MLVLNKKVCKDCYAYFMKEWTEEVEEAWEKRKWIDCPYESKAGTVLNIGPPEWCGFALDHVSHLYSNPGDSFEIDDAKS